MQFTTLTVVSFLATFALAAPVVESSNAPASIFEREDPRGPVGQVYIFGNDACNGDYHTSFEIVGHGGQRCYDVDAARSFHTAGSGCTVELFPGKTCQGDSGLRFKVQSDSRVCFSRLFASVEVKCA